MQMIGEMITKHEAGAIVNILKIATNGNPRVKISVIAKPKTLLSLVKNFFLCVFFKKPDIKCEVIFGNQACGTAPLGLITKIVKGRIHFEGLSPRIGFQEGESDFDSDLRTVSDIYVLTPAIYEKTWDVSLKIQGVDN